MLGQVIEPKYLSRLSEFFRTHVLQDFEIIYTNEAKFRSFLDCCSFKFVNSGTSALLLILEMLKDTTFQEKGFKVFIPGFCHVSSVNTLEYLHIPYEFLDVKRDTLCMDPDALLGAISSGNKPDCVIMTDMGGYLGLDSLRIMDICSYHDIILIEDAAHAFGQSYRGYKAGTIGDFGFVSFSNPKLLTSGEGGAIISKNTNIDLEMEERIYQGGWYRYNKEKRSLGLNFIMPNFLTELLAYQLEDIEGILYRHYLKFQEYLARTPDLIQSPESDNEFYAPSFFARYIEQVPKMIKDNVLTGMLHGRYHNMGPYALRVSQELEDHLVYWNI